MLYREVQAQLLDVILHEVYSTPCTIFPHLLYKHLVVVDSAQCLFNTLGHVTIYPPTPSAENSW